MKVLARELQPGDVIMPPAREVQLWMRRYVRDQGLPEVAMRLTVKTVDEAAPDKRGPWLIITADHTEAWNAQCTMPRPFRFKARPDTPWPVLNGPTPAMMRAMRQL